MDPITVSKIKSADDFDYPLSVVDKDSKFSIIINDGYGEQIHVMRCAQCREPAVEGSKYCPEHGSVSTVSRQSLSMFPARTTASLYADAFTDEKEKILFETFLQSKGNLEEEIALLKVEAVKVVQASAEEFKSTRERIKALTDIIDTMRKLILTHHELFEKLEVSVIIDLEIISKILSVFNKMLEKISRSIDNNVKSKEEKDAILSDVIEIRKWLSNELRSLV